MQVLHVRLINLERQSGAPSGAECWWFGTLRDFMYSDAFCALIFKLVVICVTYTPAVFKSNVYTLPTTPSRPCFQCQSLQKVFFPHCYSCRIYLENKSLVMNEEMFTQRAEFSVCGLGTLSLSVIQSN